MKGIRGQKVAVWGAARSGIAAANLLHELGADVVLSDLRSLADLQLEKLHPNVRIHGGGNVWGDCEVLIPSPGIPPHHPTLRRALAEGVELKSEVELAASVCPADMIAITGTDGKTTTTEMTAAALNAAGCRAEVGGNIGIPLSEKAMTLSKGDFLVAEVSAFQLWSCGIFSPRIAVVTNIAHDHTEYFGGDHQAYIAAKARLLRDMGRGQSAILRSDDAIVSNFPRSPDLDVIWFGAAENKSGWGLNGTGITHRGELVLAAEALKVKGIHNLCNAQCALATGAILGLEKHLLCEGLKNFAGLPHRTSEVREVAGVIWINDSKATNPHAAAAGLRGIQGPKIVIAGGYDKGLDLSPFVAGLGTAKCVILVGPTTPRMAAALENTCPIQKAPDLAGAVAMAASMAQSGDRVVLSPAASSFDAFESYGHRGRVFEALVGAL